MKEIIRTLVVIFSLQTSSAFSTPQRSRHSTSFRLYGSKIADEVALDTPLKPALDDLFKASEVAAKPKDAETGEGAHDAFRFEWGKWVDDQRLEELMECMNEIQLVAGVYDSLVEELASEGGTESQPRRLRVAGGDHWDCILHVLPQGTEWTGRWPTGAWAIVRSLTGVAEIAMLRGPNRDGFYTKATKKNLRGGGDGTLAGGSAGGGEDCIKYVGGALRSYAGKSGKTTLLEVVVRPPIGKQSLDGDGRSSDNMEQLEAPSSVLEVTLPITEESMEEVEEDTDVTTGEAPKHLGSKLGMDFKNVGGLDDQLDAIVRRVLASRANPEAARRLGVSHVRGILLSGPPGCGKTLLARELSTLLGAREPQIVDGPSILDKFVGEAEKNIRALFRPAEVEYDQVGDKSALHVIILDEMDAIGRKRGSVSGDTTGVRDSVVNQLLAKMDGVKEANNVLVVGLTNRPELLDPALLRPGRLEVQLRVELPDAAGRRDILRIHTRRMREAGGLSEEAIDMLEDLGEDGLPAKAEYFTGAELAGLVRSAASFALARTVEDSDTDDSGIITVTDLKASLEEVRPALGKQDEVLERRFPFGIVPCSGPIQRIMRDLNRFTSIPKISNSAINVAPSLQSMLVVGRGQGTGTTALACWAAAQASSKGDANYVRLVTSLDLLSSSGEESARAAALVDRFTEAGEMPNSLLVLDDIDQICAGSGPNGYSSIMISTLRALLRSPPSSTNVARAGGHVGTQKQIDGKYLGRSMRIIAATSRMDAACCVFNELFDETVVVPVLTDMLSVEKVITAGAEASGLQLADAKSLAETMINSLGSLGCKKALRLMELVAATADQDSDDLGEAQHVALETTLEDMQHDASDAAETCEVMY
ncbi:unnamed protein product [Cylindrotheca closterium]|uniref:Vesicle-fusing ATPase n=1 Tax=Cylindrotheca closterium TaxID=2856 RepID=A0AAD2CTL5_9STRA|nr:unnamed protein product [Cylindrotheca closterium]